MLKSKHDINCLEQSTDCINILKGCSQVFREGTKAIHGIVIIGEKKKKKKAKKVRSQCL